MNYSRVRFIILFNYYNRNNSKNTVFFITRLTKVFIRKGFSQKLGRIFSFQPLYKIFFSLIAYLPSDRLLLQILPNSTRVRKAHRTATS